MGWRKLVCSVAFALALLSPGIAGGQSAPPPVTLTPPPSWPAQPPSPGTCLYEIAGARLGEPAGYIVQLNPDTYWRPSGAQVHFTISSTSGTPPQVSRVYACFAWEMKYTTPKPGAAIYMPSPLVSNVPNANGLIEYAATVPKLDRAARHGTGLKTVQTTAWNTVPLADMQVLIELQNGQWLAVVLPVGITSAHRAGYMLAFCTALALIVLWRWAPPLLLQDEQGNRIAGFGPHSISRHALAIISSPDGVASLSQFQIILWTFVVAGSAIYVMTLSGNLIAISDGTLTLLGIAGGTSILSRVQKNNEDAANKKAGKPRPPVATPAWSQMLINNVEDKEIDVTRVQMLVFTLITAVFVSIQVVATYSIPEIPSNFQILLGISNGVYLAGRQAQPKP
jgi:hypothetical protein